MNILICYSYFCTPKGYWGTRVYENAKRWVSHGHKVTVITAPYEKSDMPKQAGTYNFDGIDVVLEPYQDNNRSSDLKRAYNAIRFMLACCKHVIKRDHDVLISSSGPLSLGIPLILSKKRRKKKTVFEVRDLWPDVPIALGKIKSPLFKYLSKWLEQYIYNNTDLVVTASPGQMEHLKKTYPSLRVDCVPNASDLDVFSGNKTKGHEAHHDQRILLHIGSLGFIHNSSYWIDVMHHIQEKNVKLIYIRDGAERKGLEQKAKVLNCENIEFKGLMPKNELVEYMHKAEATVFSTIPHPLQETCSPNKVFDSFAAGLPVIQTTKGWIGQLIERENAGINVDPNDPVLAAKEITELLNDPDRLASMANSAQHLAEKEFNRDLLAIKYIELIKELV